jgi:hypothetical protein
MLKIELSNGPARTEIERGAPHDFPRDFCAWLARPPIAYAAALLIILDPHLSERPDENRH